MSKPNKTKSLVISVESGLTEILMCQCFIPKLHSIKTHLVKWFHFTTYPHIWERITHCIKMKTRSPNYTRWSDHCFVLGFVAFIRRPSGSQRSNLRPGPRLWDSTSVTVEDVRLSTGKQNKILESRTTEQVRMELSKASPLNLNKYEFWRMIVTNRTVFSFPQDADGWSMFSEWSSEVCNQHWAQNAKLKREFSETLRGRWRSTRRSDACLCICKDLFISAGRVSSRHEGLWGDVSFRLASTE